MLDFLLSPSGQLFIYYEKIAITATLIALTITYVWLRLSLRRK